jgi:hypothetical protein
MGPDWLQITVSLLGGLIRMVGMLLLGLGVGWLTLEFLRNAQQAWQLQIAVFLGFVGLLVGMVHFSYPAALGGFGIGVGVALFFWGVPRAKPKDEPEKPAKK